MGQGFEHTAEHDAYKRANHQNHYKPKIKFGHRKDCAQNDFYKLRVPLILS